MPDATFASAGYTSMLDALTSGLNAYCHLYTNDPVIAPGLVIGDLVEVVYDGYAPLAIRKWTDAVLQDGLGFSVADPCVFTYSSGPLPLPVRGYYATLGPAGPLLWAWRRPDPAEQMNAESPTVIVLISLLFPLVCP